MSLSITIHNSFERDWLSQKEWYTRMPHTLLTWSIKHQFVDLISSHNTCSLNLYIVTLWFPETTKTFHLRSSCRWLWQWLLLQLPPFHNAQIHSLTERHGTGHVTRRANWMATHPWWIMWVFPPISISIFGYQEAGPVSHEYIVVKLFFAENLGTPGILEFFIFVKLHL